MRRLLDETDGENVELTDGIRIGAKAGWVLVLPDASDPFSTSSPRATHRTAPIAMPKSSPTASKC